MITGTVLDQPIEPQTRRPFLTVFALIRFICRPYSARGLDYQRGRCDPVTAAELHESHILHSVAVAAWGTLTRTERYILRACVDEGRGQVAIAGSLGLSQPTVSRTRTHALRTLESRARDRGLL